VEEPHAGCSGAVQASVGHAEILLGLTQVELAHRRLQPGGVRRTIEQHRELLSDPRMLVAGGRDHVVDTLPDLIEAVGSRPATALEQRLELRWRAAQHESWHDVSVPQRSPLTRKACAVVRAFARGSLRAMADVNPRELG
jgi:hypothetical protein